MRLRLVLVAVAVAIMALAPGCRCYFDPSTGTWIGVDDDPTSLDFGFWAWDGANTWMEGEGTWTDHGAYSTLTHNGQLYMEVWGITGVQDFAGVVDATASFIFYNETIHTRRGVFPADTGQGWVQVKNLAPGSLRKFRFNGVRDRDAEDEWDGFNGTITGSMSIPTSRQELSEMIRAH